MSLIRASDYKRQEERPKNQKLVQKKVRLATQDKSRKCSLCDQIATVEIKISDKETRKLCQKHLADYKRKDLKYSVKFERANK